MRVRRQRWLRIAFLVVLATLAAACGPKSGTPTPTATVDDANLCCLAMTTTPTPGITSTPTPAYPTPIPLTPGEASVTITFDFYTAQDTVDMRFPVFWGPYRTQDLRMTNMGDHQELTVRVPQGALLRYQYSVPTFDNDHREQYQKDLAVNRYVYAAADKTVTDQAYAFGWDTVARPATMHGRVTDQDGNPVLEAVVVADGILTLTVDGYYELPVRDRQQPLTVFMPDGSYLTQSRVVSPGEQDFVLTKAKPVTVHLSVYASTPEFEKVRVYGSATQFGARLIVNNQLSTDNFITMDKPVGLHLFEGQWVDYLYTIANPVISYEHGSDGRSWTIRSFMAKDGLSIDDTAGSFLGDNTVTLTVTVPDYTGPDDVIGVEGIHPTPLFMHKVDATTWVLTISNYDAVGRHPVYYKTVAGSGRETPTEHTITSVDQHDTVTSWWNQDGPIPDYQVDTPVFSNKFMLFGYPADYYSSTHDMFLGQQIQKFKDLGYQGLTLTDAWGGYTRLDPTPLIVPQDPLPAYTPIDALKKWTALAHQLGLKVMVEPQLGGAEALLAKGREFDTDWWRAWLVQIERFNVHEALKAEQAGVDYLEFHAKEPGFILPASFIPEYDAGMAKIIAEMRTVYHGQIIVDYDEWTPGLTYNGVGDAISQVSYDLNMTTKDPTQDQIDAVVNKLFDERYKPQHDATGQSVWIKIGYQSTDGQVMGNIAPEADGPATVQNHNYPLDLEEQRMIYEAFFMAAGQRDWVAGFSLFGYGFSDVPLARDVTLNGKPAEALASAWAKAMAP